MSTQSYEHILLATDLSENSRWIGERAVKIAESFDARLSLAHVVERLPVDYVAEGVPIEVPDMSDMLEAEAERNLSDLAKELGVADAECIVQLGSARVDIPQIAREKGVDLIIVGARERHGLSLLLPNTTDGVVHQAPCVVLTIHVD